MLNIVNLAHGAFIMLGGYAVFLLFTWGIDPFAALPVAMVLLFVLGYLIQLVILNQIVPHPLIEPFRTFDMHEDVKCDGWPRLMEALRKHGEGLSLPAGAASVREAVPAELRHKLWLQYCFNDLGGLGQEDELTLANEEQLDRMDSFIAHLRE